MSDLRDLIMQRVDAVELIGQYVSLQQAGSEWRGRCPFHDEKTPSFYVNPGKGVFLCRGCRAGGTIFDFVMRIENLEFRDALEWLAQKYNIEAPARTPQQQAAAGGKQRLFEINAAAAAFFRQCLARPEGEAARAYLRKRGVNAREVQDFDLGYAPREWQALGDALLSRGWRARDVEELGLIRPRQGEGLPTGGGEGRGHFDMFRHRLIFPIRNVTGRVIGFGGRALAEEDNPKYLNTSNTPLYDKSGVLYNLDRAKGSLREQGAVVVEGYMDVIGLAGAGVTNAVATCGTALTPQHVRVLSRYTDRFYLCFDSDEAGRNAAWKAGVLFLHAGYEARIVRLPSGKDPDEWARAQGELAPQHWQDLLGQSQSVVRYWLDYQLEHHPQADVVQQRKWILQLKTLYQGVPDELVRQEIQRDIASGLRLGAQEVGGLLGAANVAQPQARRGISPRTQLKQEAQQKALLQGSQPVEDEVARRLLTDKAFLAECLRRAASSGQPLAAADCFTSARAHGLFAALRSGADPAAMPYSEEHAAYAAELLTAAELLQDSNEQLLQRLENDYWQRQFDATMAEYAAAEAAGAEARLRELELRLVAIKQRIRRPGGLGRG
jgi:DNA primase